MVVPERSAGSQRLYSRDHLDQLRFVCRADAARAQRGRRAPRARRTPRRRSTIRRRRARRTRRSARFCSSSAIRTRRSSPNTSCAPRATTSTSCGPIADAERVCGEQRLDLAIVDLMIGGGAGLAPVPATRRHACACSRCLRSTNTTARSRPARRRSFASPSNPLTLVSAARDLIGTSAIVRDAEPRAAGMIERISSGHERLDALLGGGLPANGINLIIGHPGTGKTILAEQYLFHNATRGATGRLPLDGFGAVRQDPSLRRVADVLRRRRDRHVGLLRRSRRGRDPRRPPRRPRSDRPTAQGTAAGLRRHRQLQSAPVVRRRRSRVPTLPARPRRPAHARSPRSSFWIGEYDRNQAADAPEFAVADAIIALAREPHRRARAARAAGAQASRQRLPHRRARATASAPTASTCSPASPTTSTPRATPSATQRVSTGIPALDETLGDGYWPGAVTLIAGPTGAGKTLMGLHFLFHGADNGEPGVLATFQENPTQLGRIARGLRLGLRPLRRPRPRPLAGRPLRRRMGLRPPRVHRADERSPGRHRQPRRPAVRVARRHPLPRADVLARRSDSRGAASA